VTLRFLGEMLEEARCILERRQTAGRTAAGPARPAKRGAPRRREHARRTDETADRERPEPRAATVTFHRV
jgi:hypothetical protein